MNCKSLEILSRQIDALYAQFNSKTRQSNPSSAPPARTRNIKEPEGRQCIFLEGELLMFSEMTRSEVVTALQNMGLVGSAVTIITEGDPLYFVDEFTSDTYRPFDYFLQQSDLPYGFAGPEGTFQFSSPELAALRRSAAPQVVDNAYVYMGENGSYISYAEISDPNRAFHYCPFMYGLGWTKSNTQQGAEKEVQVGQFANITLRDSVNFLERRDFVDKDRFIKDIRYSWGGPWGADWPDCGIWGSVGPSNYNPGKYIGWRWSVPVNNSLNLSFRASLLNMPRDQQFEYNINPFNQRPYRGAEGVYPVILVELNEDVNIEF